VTDRSSPSMTARFSGRTGAVSGAGRISGSPSDIRRPVLLEKDLVIDSFNHTFGGILQYTARAIADYERHQREIEATARGARDAAKIRHATEAIQSEAQAKRTALAEADWQFIARGI